MERFTQLLDHLRVTVEDTQPHQRPKNHETLRHPGTEQSGVLDGDCLDVTATGGRRNDGRGLGPSNGIAILQAISLYSSSSNGWNDGAWDARRTHQEDVGWYMGFEGVGVQGFIQMLDHLRVTLKDAERKSLWLRLLLEILRTSEGVQLLPRALYAWTVRSFASHRFVLSILSFLLVSRDPHTL